MEFLKYYCPTYQTEREYEKDIILKGLKIIFIEHIDK